MTGPQKREPAPDLERKLIEVAKRLRIGVFFDRRALAQGQPHIHLKARGVTLECFRNADAAIRWIEGGQP